MRRTIVSVCTVVGVYAWVLSTVAVLVLGVATVDGCESSHGTGFCAAPGLPPAVSWDHGPLGTTVTVGPLSAHMGR